MFVAAFAWRAVHAPRLALWHIDEVRFSLPTAQDFAAGQWYPYIRGTNYGAPIHEAAAALLFRLFGESLVALRIPVAFFSAVAVVVALLVLRRVLPGPAAIGIALVLAFPNSALTRYGVGGHPVYAALTILVLGLVWGAWEVDRHRTRATWVAWACLAGFSVYALKLAIFPVFVSLLWLGLRSNSFRQWRRATRLDALRRQALARASFVAALGVLLLSPVAYRWLTRRATYSAGSHEVALLCVGGALLLLGAIGLYRASRAPWRRCWPAAVVALAIVAFTAPPAVHFKYVEKPRLAAARIELWPEKSYSLKHWHEMPFQLRLLLDRVLPALVIGRWSELDGVPPQQVPLTWKTGVSVAVLATLLVGAWARLTPRAVMRSFRSRKSILVAPVVLVVFIMFPSWALHSDTNFRYLVPFSCGLYLLAWECMRSWLAPRPRFTAIVLGFYLTYSGIDCWRHLS
ncbi:MAG: hypothetical protein KF878_07715 [Planctomycetes bacterium]|nr:hypothetical protein [Planctomycetota bacterium]